MSGSQDKKLRKKIRKHVKVEAPEVATGIQQLILDMSWWPRFKVAWKIIKGKRFIGKPK